MTTFSFRNTMLLVFLCVMMLYSSANAFALTTLDLSKNWVIVNNSDDPVAACAAKELARTLLKISGKNYEIVKTVPKQSPAFILTYNMSDNDGYQWNAHPDHIIFTGNNQRGLLYAVYDFLESLGCRWVAPGAEYERITQGKIFMVADSSPRKTPSVSGRCLILGHSAFLDDAEKWIIWAARNKMNTIFIHVVPSAVATGAASIPLWERKKASALVLLKERGMIIEYGGHGLADFLPRKLFKQHPDAFRMSDGIRINDYNFLSVKPDSKRTDPKKCRSIFQRTFIRRCHTRMAG